MPDFLQDPRVLGIGAAVIVSIIGIALFLWRRDLQKKTISELESESKSKAYEEAKKLLGRHQKIRDRYDSHRESIPDVKLFQGPPDSGTSP